MSVLSGTVLVTGASGNTGRPLVEALVNRGASVRAMVRAQGDSARLAAGVEPAVADFDDPASLRAALEGTVAAYLVTPSSEKAEEQQRRFADLAARAGVGRLVVLSQLGADRESPVRFLRYHGAVEEHVRGLGIPHTFLRPNLFFQGLPRLPARSRLRTRSSLPSGRPGSAPSTCGTSPPWAPSRSPRTAMTAPPTR